MYQEDLKVHTNILQEEILKLKSQSEVKQKQLENSEGVQIFTSLQEDYSRLKLQLQNQVEHATMLEEENSKLVTRLRPSQKILKDIEHTKVCNNILKEENSELQSQLEITQEQLKLLKVEKKRYIDKYSALINKQTCDISIQTQMVSAINIGNLLS